MINHWFQ